MQFFYLMSHLHERIRSIQYTFSNPSILLLLSTMSLVIYLPFLIKRSSIFHPLSIFFSCLVSSSCITFTSLAPPLASSSGLSTLLHVKASYLAILQN